MHSHCPPPPLCGIPDANTVRSLYDYSLWLDSLPDYGLTHYNSVLRQVLVNIKTESVNHVPGRAVILTSLYVFETRLFERQGWHGLPGSVPPLSPQDEKSLLTPLLEGLSTHFKLNLDTLPNLSRDPSISPPGSAPAIEDTGALFIGTSNAHRLANSAATLGIIAKTITTGGWILTTDAVSGILPQVNAYCASLPADAPVVIYCLDNVSFCCANSDGQISAISKLKDGIFHVVGEIVVVHKVTLAAAVTNLKRIILACGDGRVSETGDSTYPDDSTPSPVERHGGTFSPPAEGGAALPRVRHRLGGPSAMGADGPAGCTQRRFWYIFGGAGVWTGAPPAGSTHTLHLDRGTSRSRAAVTAPTVYTSSSRTPG